jgi:hypothetical protein
MARTLRQGFIDPERTDDFPENFAPGTSKAAIVRDLRHAGYVVGKELELHETKVGITVTDVHRTGNIASGFSSRDGYDLRDVDSWTPQQKSKLTRIFNTVKSLSERPFQIYRPRKRENLQIVQDASQHLTSPPEINVAFVPISDPSIHADIKISKRKVVKVTPSGKKKEIETPLVAITQGEVIKMPTLWKDVGVTKKQLEKDPVKATKILVAEMKKHGAKRFTPMAGEREFSRSFTEEELYDEVKSISELYPRWAVFLIGIQAFDMPKRSDLVNYRKKKRAAKAAQAAANRKSRVAFRAKVKAEEARRKQQRKKRR